MPQTPARVDGAELPDVSDVKKEAYYKTFDELVQYLSSAIGKSLGQVIYNYTLLVSFYSHKCYHWKEDGTGKPPTDYFRKTFPGCEIPETGRKVSYHIGQLFAALENLRKIRLQEAKTLEWSDFWNQWPPLPQNGECRLESDPFDTHITRPVRGKIEVTELKGTVSVKLVMDTQGYNIPRGFTIEVDGVEYFIRVGQEDEDPSSSSSSSSAYSSNPFGGD